MTYGDAVLSHDAPTGLPFGWDVVRIKGQTAWVWKDHNGVRRGCVTRQCQMWVGAIFPNHWVPFESVLGRDRPPVVAWVEKQIKGMT